MKTLFIIVLTFSFSFHLSAQWVEQESGTDNNLYRLYFLDNDNGWIIGEKIILKTVNGGQEWVDKSPSIAFDVYYKRCIFFYLFGLCVFVLVESSENMMLRWILSFT